MNEIFKKQDAPYNFSQSSYLHISSVNTVFIGASSIRFIEPKIWEIISGEINSFMTEVLMIEKPVHWFAE